MFVFHQSKKPYPAGLPDPLDDNDFERNFNEARTMMEDEANRTRSGFTAGGLGQQSQQAGNSIPRQQQMTNGMQSGGGQATAQPDNTQYTAGQQAFFQQQAGQQQFNGQVYGMPTQQPNFHQPSTQQHAFQPQHSQQSAFQQPVFQQPAFQQPIYLQQAGPQLPLVQPEQQRIQPYPLGPDPAFLPPSQATQSINHNIQQLKMMFPFVSNFTDEYILSQPLDTLYRLHREEKHAEAGSAARGLESRLHQNLKKAMDSPVFIDGYNNRTSFLHPARFLPGAGVPVSQLWLEARKIWG